MKKFFIFIVIAVVFALIIGIIAYNNNNNNGNQNQGGTRLSANVNEENAENRLANILEDQNESREPAEKEISSFATEILDDSPGRLNNISITCSTLNNTIVKAGETFSFNETVGKPTVERGYQEAKIIVDHEAELGIGGRKLPSK